MRLLLGLPRALRALWVTLTDRRTPWSARLVALAAALYAIWPLDIVPDVIPLAGLLDELVVVPALLALANRLVPPHLRAEIARRDAARPPGRRRKAVLLLVALLALAALAWWGLGGRGTG